MFKIWGKEKKGFFHLKSIELEQWYMISKDKKRENSRDKIMKIIDWVLTIGQYFTIITLKNFYNKQ